MKRSEMLTIISTELDDINYDNAYDIEGSLTCAERILNVIEEVGMLPPNSKLNKLNGVDNYWENEDDSI